MGITLAVLTHVAYRLRGRSQSVLARASDGFTYVVKFGNRADGPNGLFNESMGTELYRSARLPVPDWRPLLLTRQMIDRHRAFWPEDTDQCPRPREGLCFGSRFLKREDAELFEILPGSSFKRVRNRDDFWTAWLIDVCAGHADNRQALFLEDTQPGLSAVFIDQGHMFCGPRGTQRPDLRASRYYLDPRVYPDVSLGLIGQLRATAARIDGDQLWNGVKLIPDQWKTHSALQNFKECLDTLANPAIIEKIVERIIDSADAAGRYRNDATGSLHLSVESILRPGVHGAGFIRSVVA